MFSYGLVVVSSEMRREPLTPEFTKTVHNNRLLERLPQALLGRFLTFAPISYMAPQNLSKSDPNYQFLTQVYFAEEDSGKEV
jgi:hypothetical protein